MDLEKQIESLAKDTKQDWRSATSESVTRQLALIKRAPVVKDAVLEFIGEVLDHKIRILLKNEGKIENKRDFGKKKDEESVAVVEKFCSDLQEHFILLSKNPFWSLHLLKWSVNLMGRFSQFHRGKCPDPTQLELLLDHWEKCQPMHLLLTIAANSFTSLAESQNGVSCILEASVKYGVYFDWIVAYLGHSFPGIIIHKVMICALRDFADCDANDIGSERPSTVESAVKILDHLSLSHSEKIYQESKQLVDSFFASSESESIAVLPFLLHLATRSKYIRRLIVSLFIQYASSQNLQKAVEAVNKWKTKKNMNMNRLIELVIDLLKNVDDQSKPLLVLFFNLAETHDGSTELLIRGVLEKLLVNLSLFVFANDSSSEDIPMLSSLQRHASFFTEKLCSCEDENVRRLVFLLITTLAIYSGETVAAQILSEIICGHDDAHHMLCAIELQLHTEYFMNGILPLAVKFIVQTLTTDSSCASRVFKNLIFIIRWQNSNSDRVCRNLADVLRQDHLGVLASLVMRTSFAPVHLGVELLSLISLEKTTSVKTVWQLCVASSANLFGALRRRDSEEDRNHYLGFIENMMIQLASLGHARTILIKLLAQGAFQQETRQLFVKMVEVQRAEEDRYLSLTEANNQMAQSLPRSKLAPIHTGRLINRSKKVILRTDDAHVTNISHLVRSLRLLCSYSTDGEDPTESGRCVLARELLLIASPNCIHRQWSWGDRDVIKQTIERDIYVKQKFEECPFLWDLFDVLIPSREALLVCIPLFRSLFGYLVIFWEGCRKTKASDGNEWPYRTTCQLIDLLSKGQLLPNPLGQTKWFSHVSPLELQAMLLNIWSYFKDRLGQSVATCTVGSRCDKVHRDVIRWIVHRNIGTGIGNEFN